MGCLCLFSSSSEVKLSLNLRVNHYNCFVVVYVVVVGVIIIDSPVSLVLELF